MTPEEINMTFDDLLEEEVQISFAKTDIYRKRLSRKTKTKRNRKSRKIPYTRNKRAHERRIEQTISQIKSKKEESSR